MDVKSYWQKRFDALENMQHDQGVEAYNRISEQYTRAIAATEKEIAKWYTRYATEAGISLQEAQRLLNGRELAELRMDVKEYIAKGKSNLDGRWTKELEAASAKVHVSRLQAMQLQMQQQAEKLAGYTSDGLDRMARKVYTDGYYHTAFEIQKGLGVGWDFAQLDTRKIDKVLNTPWAADGSNFSARVWKNRTQLVSELESTFTQGIIRGLSPQKTIKAIAERMQVSEGRVKRLVLTENAYFASAATNDAFKALDIEQFEVVATLDSRTTETCRHMDGKHFPMKDYKPGTTAPPFHVFCRSTTVPYFDDEFTEGEERAARDEDNNKYYTIPSQMKYPDWKNIFVDKKISAEAWLAQYAYNVKLDRLEAAAQKAETEYTAAETAFKAEPNTSYSGIWKDDVTLSDYELKKGGIKAKNEYFDQQIAANNDVAKFTQLKADLAEFKKKGRAYAKKAENVKQLKKNYTDIKAELDKHKNGGIIKDNPFSEERKNAALWAKSVAAADKELRTVCGDVWKAASKAEKDAIYDYTSSYSKFNEPLRGIEYGTNKFLGVGNVDLETIGMNYSGFKRGQVKALIDNMTNIIEKSSYDIDVWVQRGVNYGGMDKFFGIDPSDFNLPENELAAKLVDTTPTEYGFLSTGVAKGKGFSSSPIILNIYSPKGTKMMYAEPFSAYGNGAGRNWNGITSQSSFGSEAEMIFQRGTRFKVTKVEKSNGKIYIDMDVLEQEDIT